MRQQAVVKECKTKNKERQEKTADSWSVWGDQTYVYMNQLKVTSLTNLTRVTWVDWWIKLRNYTFLREDIIVCFSFYEITIWSVIVSGQLWVTFFETIDFYHLLLPDLPTELSMICKRGQWKIELSTILFLGQQRARLLEKSPQPVFLTLVRISFY